MKVIQDNVSLVKGELTFVHGLIHSSAGFESVQTHRHDVTIT